MGMNISHLYIIYYNQEYQSLNHATYKRSIAAPSHLIIVEDHCFFVLIRVEDVILEEPLVIVGRLGE